MVGHSKWSKVKHIQGPLEAKRGAVSGKLVSEITVAAWIGGGHPSVVAAPDQENYPAADLLSIFSQNRHRLVSTFPGKASLGGQPDPLLTIS